MDQIHVDHDFVMIASFWEQRTPTEKYFTLIGAAKIRLPQWERLWSPFTIAQPEELDSVVKVRTINYLDARSATRKKKRQYLMHAAHAATIVINPKIQEKQRRVQCSLPYHSFWQLGLETPRPADQPVFWTRPFQNPVPSTPREFKRGSVLPES